MADFSKNMTGPARLSQVNQHDCYEEVTCCGQNFSAFISSRFFNSFVISNLTFRGLDLKLATPLRVR